MRINTNLALILSWLLFLCAPRLASAASLQEVQGFGNNPSNVRMFLYVPDRVAPAPPILVALHYCGGNAMQYFNGTGYRTLADQHGFIVIYPQTTHSDGCFDVASNASLSHDGGSDSAGIVSMVRHVIARNGADAQRVYVAGTSSGAMMTNVLLGAYPDVFRGGASFAGVPFGCFASPGRWNSACATGQTSKSAQEWGNLVRAAYPGYQGPRPRVQLWHGDRDETLNFRNFGEAIKQWTNVLGVSEQATTSELDVPQRGWTRTRYADTAGVVQVEAVLESGVNHNLSVPAAEVIRFFGLDGKADPGGVAGVDAGTAPDAGLAASDAGADAANARADAGAPGDSGTTPRADASVRGDSGSAADGAQGPRAADAGAPLAVADASADGGNALAPSATDPEEGDDDDGGCSLRSAGQGANDPRSASAATLLVTLALLTRRRSRGRARSRR